MIALDTNVVSELMRPVPDPRVLRWVDAQSSDSLVVTSVTVAELLYGIAGLPASRKRSQLEAAIAATFDEDLVILPFDDAAAVDYATIVASQDLRGRKVAMADAMIAATCLSAGAMLATRNTKDFAHLGIELVDPWA
jgi:predicted nucleic acid-binding protein